MNLAGTVPAQTETNQHAGAAAQARRIARSFRSDRLKQHESAPEPLLHPRVAQSDSETNRARRPGSPATVTGSKLRTGPLPETPGASR